MADTKISALPASTVPLAGTEVLPIVQSSTTVKVTNNDLRPKQIQSNATSGVLQIAGPGAATTRVMTTPNANFTAARTDAAQSFTGSNTFDSTTLCIDSTNHRVGVGTALPGSDLEVKAATPELKVTSSTGTNANGITFNNTGGNFYVGRDNSGGGYYGSGTAYSSVIWSTGAYPLVIAVNNAETWRFDTSSNLVPKTAAKGINFTANTPAAGMTSQLLNWYEEGTWTPNQGAGLTLVGAFTSTGRYTRIGRQVSISGTVTGATSVAVVAAGVITSNLPFTVVTAGHGGATNAANNASATVICTNTSVTSAAAIAATTTITFSATYFV
jgi:hypothetical protein